ncbi:MAG: alpha-galactosidase, partial [Clostridia bacterium]|nr:alpha-galactosidase [Clostridia bacterium]
ARAYIKHFFDVVLNQWGYDMVKLDFLYSQCMYPRAGRSRGQIMREAMAFLRECCGDKLILGCGVHHGASFGYIDACRISCDVDLKYGGKFYNRLHVNNEIPSAQNAITNAIFRRHLDGRAFCNDPDVFFLRYSNLDFTMDQKLLLAGINHICGNVLFVSDNAEEYTDNDIRIVKDAFAKTEIKVLSACYVTGDNVEMRLLKDGSEVTLAFNMTTGASNIREIMGW